LKIAWRDRRQPFNVRFAVEMGWTHDGRWFGYVHVRGKNYWIRSY